VFEVSSTGATLWQYQTTGQIFHAHFVDRALWASGTTITLTQGGNVALDLILGAAHAGESYVLVASASGTSPGTPVGSFVVPLNLDALTLFTLDQANTAWFVNTLGTLNGQGRAQGSVVLPALAGLPSALPTHWSAVVWNPATFSVRGVSVAVPITLLP
jgi:hypothetical protein